MVNRVPLNNIDHQGLKVRAQSAGSSDAVNQALILPNEFEAAQREYPILFRRDADGNLQAVALLGLDKGENLFLDDSGWSARYVPAVHRRGPFFIGITEQERGGELRHEPTIFVDLDDPRVSEVDGEPLFLPHGGNAPYLERVSGALQLVQAGMQMRAAMFDLFTRLELIAPVQVEIELPDGHRYELPNFQTISQERFAALTANELAQLHATGFLSAAIFARSSLANMQRLIDLKNSRREER